MMHCFDLTNLLLQVIINALLSCDSGIMERGLVSYYETSKNMTCCVKLINLFHLFLNFTYFTQGLGWNTVVEHLPSIPKDLGLIFSTIKNKIAIPSPAVK